MATVYKALEVPPGSSGCDKAGCEPDEPEGGDEAAAQPAAAAASPEPIPRGPTGSGPEVVGSTRRPIQGEFSAYYTVADEPVIPC